MRQQIDPGWAWAKQLDVSALVKVGNTVYLSGAVALDHDGQVVGHDVYSQSRQVFRNVEEALACAGASMTDVTKITTFLTDMSGHREFGMARAEAFPGGVPASAVFGTDTLAQPDLLVSVEVIAVIVRKA